MTAADNSDFEAWYRTEHKQLLGVLTVASGSVDVAQDVVS